MASQQSPEERTLTTLHTVVLATEVFRQAGVERARLLEGSGVAELDLQTPDKLITHAQELRVFANALTCHRDPGLGLYLGLRMHVSAYGILGYSMLASQTLRDALNLALAYPELLGTYFHLALQDHGDEFWLSAEGYRYAPELTVFNSELCMTSLLTVVRDLLGESVRPRRLLLAYRPPLHAHLYAERLGCPVEFGAPTSALCFSPALLDRRLPLADPVSCHDGQQRCQRMSTTLSSRGDLLAMMRQHLASHLPDASSLDAVARHLHRSSRTLRRHLQQHNTSYQQVLDEVRFDKARQLLKDTDLPIYLIAERLGYSETASFRHAFQRWSGATPSLFRG
ncbi:MAG: putative HTH-type transcriptional regulator [Pseudomonas citronellolis]|nr:MAG: putative HTH-type transcriptional regulator [Pseudomonas citronellolis]